MTIASVCFILPKYQRRPIGGYKIVYEYANRLVGQGLDVSILHINSPIRTHYKKLPDFVIRTLADAMTAVEPRWFPLDRRIRKASDLNSRMLGEVIKSDAVVATSVGTVDYAYRLFKQKKVIYLVQDYETWNGNTEADVIRSYETDSKKIVISTWLKGLVDRYAPEPSTIIPNPIDCNRYTCSIAMLERQPFSVGLLYHNDPRKGVPVSLKVVRMLKERYPQLQVHMFGACKPSFELPEWVDFTFNATQDETIEIYNKCRVFLCSSIDEGFGLTGFESLACGCVLVSTDYASVHEYAKDGYNALLAPVNDADALCENVSRVFEDDKLASQLSKNGIESVKRFSWEEALCKFMGVLNS